MKNCKVLRYLLTTAALLSGLGLGTVSSPQPALAVTDLSPSHWAASTINAYVSRGIMSGYPDGTFRPEVSVTRAEFVKMVNSVFGYNTAASISFPDVSSTYWGYDEIAKGVYAGYINGDENGNFNPESPLTREEAASIICRIKGLAPNQTASADYTDSAKIATWAAPYVGAVTQFGYMQGGGDGAFNPTSALTRAEAATVLAKAESKTTYPSSTNSTTNNVTNNNVQFKPTTSTSSSTNKVTDYTLGSNETSLSGKTITGNLYIPSSLGSKTVNLDDLTVEGTVYVRGGSTIDVDNCDFNKVVLDKSGVIFTADSKSNIDQLDFWRNGRIEGKGYGTVNIADDSVSTANVNATVENLVLDTDANLRLGNDADIDNLEATSSADDANIYFAKDAYVGDMEIYDRIEITGSGEINKMYAHVSGIYSSIEPNKLITSGSGSKPTYTNKYDDDDNSSSSNNNSSSSTNRPGSSTTTTVKDLVVTGNINGSSEKKGNATYDTVTVTNANVTISNVVIDEDLVIEASVGDGSVTLNHVDVKGQVYIHGGGQNSIIFSDCNLENNIYIDKVPTEKAKQPVGLQLNNGTELKGDVIISNNANISTSPKEHVLNKVTVNGTLSEPLLVDANINKVSIETYDDVTLTLANSTINSLSAGAGKVTAKGEGFINDVSSVADLEILEKVNLPNLKTIINLSGIPNTMEIGGVIKLDSCQATYDDGTTATISNVIWAIADGQTAEATITGNLLTAAKEGSFTLNATVKNGKDVNVAYTQSIPVKVNKVFVPAEKITVSPDLPTAATLVEKKDGDKISEIWELDLSKYEFKVEPENATVNETPTNQVITWSVKRDGSNEGVKITDNKLLTVTKPGKVVLTATIANGKGSGNPLAQTFTINVDNVYHEVENIKFDEKRSGLTYDDANKVYLANAGTPFTLYPIVEPDNAKYKEIRWELVEGNNTGITSEDLKNNANPKITTNQSGEIILKAYINGGLDEGKGVYDQTLTIKVNPPLVSDIITKPLSLDGKNTFYPGQTIRLSLKDNIMDTYAKDLVWTIANQESLDRYVTDPNAMPTLKELTDSKGQKNGLAELEIPEKFPTDEISTIEIKVQNGRSYQTLKITVGDEFVPVTGIEAQFDPVEEIVKETVGDLEITKVTIAMQADNGQNPINLDVIIEPEDATCQDIEWRIPTRNSGATIENNQLSVTKAGTFDLVAKIPNGEGPGTGQDYTKTFKVTVLVPPIGPITAETDQLTGCTEKNQYYTGQKVTLSMDQSILDQYGDDIKWTIDGKEIQAENKDANKKVTFTIEDEWAGKTIKVTAENGDEEAPESEAEEIEILVKEFTSPTSDQITILAPPRYTFTDESNNTVVKATIDDTFKLSYETEPTWMEDVQSIRWSISKATRVTASTIDAATGVLTIGKEETAEKITVVATVVNGQLDATNNKLVDGASKELDISVDRIPIRALYYKDGNDYIELEDNKVFYAGEKVTFYADNDAIVAHDKDIKWSISNEKELGPFPPGTSPAISETGGALTGTSVLKDGTILEITATVNDVPTTVPITIKTFTPPTGITISTDSDDNKVIKGETLELSANVTPEDASNKDTITWSITGAKKSGTKITTTEDGKVTLTVAPDETASSITVKATIPHAKLTNTGTWTSLSSQTITIKIEDKPADPTPDSTEGQTLSLQDIRNQVSTLQTQEEEEDELTERERIEQEKQAERERIEQEKQAERDRIAAKNNSAPRQIGSGVSKYQVSAD